MATAGISRICRSILLTITIFSLSLPAYAKYSGGTGDPNDPYQIATAEDLMLLGNSPEDYDKHFILTADIDLDPNLPGRKVFDKAVIAPDTDPNDKYSQFQGTPFTGVFDGNGHTISHLTIKGGGYLGLFGQLGDTWPFVGEVEELGVLHVNITGSAGYVGGLIGYNDGSVTDCRSTGAVSGADCVGGLVGSDNGSIDGCYSSASVSGEDVVGGLAGGNGGLDGGLMAGCCSTGSVSGKNYVGGLVGSNDNGSIAKSYSTGSVTGEYTVGGLVGDHGNGSIVMSYSVSSVSGYDVAGLANVHGFREGWVDSSFWDIETSGQATSAGGTGKTTAEMMDPNTFMAAGWDFVGQPDGPHDIWAQPEGGGYPILWWQLPAGFGLPDFSGGTGEANDPYLIATGEELNSIGHNPRLMACHFALANDLDLVGLGFYPIGSWDFPYVGVFDGKGHTISHLTGSNGLFDELGRGAHVRNVGVVDVSIVGWFVGGLVGDNHGSISACYSSGSVNSGYGGGLVGWNYGSIAACYSSASVSSVSYAGGLVGENSGSIAACYSSGSVSGTDRVGGLVGNNAGSISACYSTGAVSGREHVGGLIGSGWPGYVTASFWNIQTSWQTTSAGGTDRTTAEMQTANTFLDAGWDFMGETANGPNDLWKIVEGQTYPLLSWQKYSGGSGEPNDPYQIATAEDLIALGETPDDYGKHFILTADIDLDPNLPGGRAFDRAVIAPDVNDPNGLFDGTPFTGVFDGNGHVVSHLTIKGASYLGLFGQLECGRPDSPPEVRNLGVLAVNVMGSGDQVGGLVGSVRNGLVTECYSTGSVSGASSRVGGLLGSNDAFWYAGAGGPSGRYGHVSQCFSTATVTVSGSGMVGGLIGYSSYGYVSECYSTGVVSGGDPVSAIAGTGGLIGTNVRGRVRHCYSTSVVSGSSNVGGLLGHYVGGAVADCFWDTQTSGTLDGVGSKDPGVPDPNSVMGKSTDQMKTAQTFLDAGWDFVGETANGTEDIWWILEGKDYPRLWWETEGN